MKEWIITDKRQTDKLLTILQGIRRETILQGIRRETTRTWLIHELDKAIDIVIGQDKCGIEEAN
jgi:hypothetical protein